MLFAKYIVYNSKMKENTFICVYFGYSLEESPIFCSDNKIRNNNFNNYQDFRISLSAKIEGFASI